MNYEKVAHIIINILSILLVLSSIYFLFCDDFLGMVFSLLGLICHELYAQRNMNYLKWRIRGDDEQ